MPLDFSGVTVSGPLVSLDDTKTFLRITDTDHDADVSRVFDAAQETILRYLGPAGDATWDDTTAPRAVVHAILLLTGHLYEHRGDDLAPDAAVWTAIANLLGRHRDPTLG